MTPPATTREPAAFVTTHWTRVLEARGDSLEAQAALSDLCAAYYAPVLAFLRRSGRDDDAARDLAQEFFARLLARRGLDTVEPGRGRFRSFLLGAVKHFLADQHDRAHAAKRGGGQTPLPLDVQSTGDTTHGGGGMNSAFLQVPDPAAVVPDTFFDRQWALTILERALAALAVEYETASKRSRQPEIVAAGILPAVEPGFQPGGKNAEHLAGSVSSEAAASSSAGPGGKMPPSTSGRMPDATAPTKPSQFETLKPWLTGDTENLSQADAARRLDLNEGAVKVAIHRLRKCFRELVKAEIAQTVGNGADVQVELSYLLEVLSHPG
jgi:DNA-directed RNA polymerase specialized sigma24 family protein